MRLAIRIITSCILAYIGLFISARLLQSNGIKPPAAMQQILPYSSTQALRYSLTAKLEHTVSQQTDLQDIHALAVSAPLDPLPYTIRMIDESNASDLVRASALSKHIKRINPRHRVAYFVSAQIALANSQPKQALDDLARLVVLDKSNQQDYLASMVEVVLSSGDIAALEELLAEKPVWGGRFVNMLSEHLTDVQVLQKLYKYYPENQSQFVRAVAKTGDLERAYIAFLSFLSEEELNTATVPYDSEFKGLNGAMPFNWVVNDQFTEFERSGGLYVSFFGKGHPTLAEQILALSPGAYSVSVEISGELYQYGGSFEWILQCAGQRDNVMSLEINTLTATKSIFQSQFDIPNSDCNFQRLRLLGVAGEYPRTTRAEISSINIQMVSDKNQ